MLHRQLAHRRHFMGHHFLKAGRGLNRLDGIQGHRGDVRPSLDQEPTLIEGGFNRREIRNNENVMQKLISG